MQGLRRMEKTPGDLAEAMRLIRDARKERRKDLQEEMRLLSKHKKRLKVRLKEGLTWPIDSATGERADLDHEDVMAPLPDDMRAPIGNVDENMQKLRADVEGHESFAESIVPVDEGVLVRRRSERQQERTDRAAVRGEKWTEELVEARIDEAFKTLFRASGGPVGPREFGNAMPTPVRQMSDLVAQAGNKSLRRAMERMRRSLGPPSHEEVRRMDEALMWSVAYLRDDHPDLATFLNMGGMWKAWGAKVTRKCKELGVHRQAFYRDRRAAVRKIVEGLTRDGKAPL